MSGPVSILIVLVFFGVLTGIIYVAAKRSGNAGKAKAARQAARQAAKDAKQADRKAKRLDHISTSMSQSDLYDTAMNAKDRDEALAAAEALSDQGLLRMLAMQASHRDRVGPRRYIAERAVKRLDDQDLLYQVATEATDYVIQLQAARKLESQERLERIVFWEGKLNHVGDEEVRKAAVERLTDQGPLRSIAFDWGLDRRLRDAASQRLTDMADIERFAREEPFHEGRWAALKRIEDADLRRDIQEHWSDLQKRNDREFHERESRVELNRQKQQREREQSRRWAAEGRCPHCGVPLATPRGGIPDGAVAYCSNCNGRVS